MNSITFWIFAAGVIFAAGGLVTWAKISINHIDQKHEKDMQRLEDRIESLETRLNTHEEHFVQHDVIFENIAVNQKYMIQGIDRIDDRLQQLEEARIREA